VFGATRPILANGIEDVISRRGSCRLGDFSHLSGRRLATGGSFAVRQPTWGSSAMAIGPGSRRIAAGKGGRPSQRSRGIGPKDVPCVGTSHVLCLKTDGQRGNLCVKMYLIVSTCCAAESTEPPYTDPYVRWCGRGRSREAPPYPDCCSIGSAQRGRRAAQGSATALVRRASQEDCGTGHQLSKK
jgi:hypothetical protein